MCVLLLLSVITINNFLTHDFILVLMREKEREREREREIHTYIHTYIHTDRQTDRHTWNIIESDRKKSHHLADGEIVTLNYSV